MSNLKKENSYHIDRNAEVSFMDVFNVLYRQRKIFLYLFLILAAAVMAVVFKLPNVYTARAVVIANANAPAYRAEMQATSVYSTVVQQLGMDAYYKLSLAKSELKLHGRIRVVNEPLCNLNSKGEPVLAGADVACVIYASDENPDVAAKLANVYADAAIKRLQKSGLTGWERRRTELNIRLELAAREHQRATDLLGTPAIQAILQTIPSVDIERLASLTRMHARVIRGNTVNAKLL